MNGSKTKASYWLLSFLTFFQLIVFGTLNPLLSQYLQQYLGLDGYQTAWVMAVSVVAIIFTPMVAAFLLNKNVGTRRLYIICHGIAASASIAISFQTEFTGFLIGYIVLTLAQGPTIGLLNSMTFANLKDSSKQYGPVRLWGTIGWMTAGWIIGWLWSGDANSIEALPRLFYVQGGASIASLLIALRVPKVAPQGKKKGLAIFDKEALDVFKLKPIIAITLVFFLSAILDQFYWFGMGPHLSAIGYTNAEVASLLPLGQVLEIGALFFMGPILKKLGFRTTMTLGMLFQVARFSFFASSVPGLVISAITFNGFVFAFVYSSATVYIDSYAGEKVRGSVHQISGMLTFGLSRLVGVFTSGALQEAFRGEDGVVDYNSFWLVPLAIAVVLTVLTLGVIREPHKPQAVSERLPDTVPLGTPSKPDPQA